MAGEGVLGSVRTADEEAVEDVVESEELRLRTLGALMLDSPALDELLSGLLLALERVRWLSRDFSKAFREYDAGKFDVRRCAIRWGEGGHG